MTDTEQEALKLAWLERAMGVSLREASSSHRAAFTAGYLAHQQAVAQEREHLEDAVELLWAYQAGNDSYELKVQFDAWLEHERLRRSKQEGSGS